MKMRCLAFLWILISIHTSWASLAWSPADSTPAPTGRSAIGQVGRYVYLFGGGPNGDAALAYDCSTSHWVSSTLFPLGYRSNWAGVAAQGRLYVLGGSDSLYPQSDVYAFLPGSGGSGTWIRRASLPRPLALLGAAALGDSLIITAGGLTYLSYATSQCFRYHIAQDRWDALPPLPQARIAGGLVAQGGKLYLLGGLDSTAQSYTNTIYEYDPGSNQWRTRRTLLTPMAFSHQSIASDGRLIYLVGGGAGVPLWPGSNLVQAWNPQNDSMTWETSLPETVGVQSTCFGAWAGSAFLLATGGFRDSLYVSRTFRSPLPVGVEQAIPPSPFRSPQPVLFPLSPNPARGPLFVRWFLPAPGPVRLEVYDLQGRLVRSLFEGPAPAGEVSAGYDGRARDGRPLAAGVYFLTLSTPQGSSTRSFIRLR